MASENNPRERFSIEAASDHSSPFAAIWPEVRAATDPKLFSAGKPVRLAALPVTLSAPPHPSVDMLSRISIEGVVLPLGRALAHGRDWIVCGRPTRPSVKTLTGLDERTLLTWLLRPAAAVLERLEQQKLVHRAIRPENMFASEDGVELGPFWMAPPAYHQPAVFETPSVASCPPAARGRGSIADDVYALGVTLLALYLGETPMAELSDAEVIERKLWLGSFAALTEGRRIPFALAEVIAAMVSDQASQRPAPERLRRSSALSGPATSSRKRVNAAIPMVLAGREVWNAPQLAFVFGEDPETAAAALENGQIDGWLRRGLNEVVVAERIETLVYPGGLRSRTSKAPDPVERTRLLGRVVHALDPEAPCLWDRMRMMPDGLPGLLAAMGSDRLITPERVRGLLGSDLLVARVVDEPAGLKRELASSLARRAMVAVRSPAALIKLRYELNPSMGCASPMLAQQPINGLATLLPALEAVAPTAPEGRLLDQDLLGFIAVRRQAAGMRNVRSGDGVTELRLLAALWEELRPGPLPALAGRLAKTVLAELASWPGRSRQGARRARIEAVVAAGDLTALLGIADDQQALGTDQAAMRAARSRIKTLRALRQRTEAEEGRRREAALRFGREGVVVLGTAACAIALMLVVAQP